MSYKHQGKEREAVESCGIIGPKIHKLELMESGTKNNLTYKVVQYAEKMSNSEVSLLESPLF